MSDIRYTAWADRLYRLLLRLYPREVRERFGGDMTDFFRDRRLAAHGALGVARVWWSAVADIVRIAALERFDVSARRMRAIREGITTDTARITLDSRDEDMFATLMGDLRYAIRGMVAKRA